MRELAAKNISKADGHSPPLGIASADGLFSVDSDQRIVSWSESARRVLGFTAGEAEGRRCYEVLGQFAPPGSRFCRRDCPVIVNSRRGRQTSNYDLSLRSRSGKDMWINVSILLLTQPGRRRPLTVHLVRDVTRRRKLEQVADNAMTSLRDLAAESNGGYPAALDLATAQGPAPVLTRRELEVLRMLACGVSAAEIAKNLVISPITVRNHITNVMAKVGAKSRLQAVAYASRRRLL